MFANSIEAASKNRPSEGFFALWFVFQFSTERCKACKFMPCLFLDAFQTGGFHLDTKYFYFLCKICIKIALLPCLCRNCLVARLHLPPLRGTPRNDRTSAGSLRERRIAAAFSSAHYLNESPMKCCWDLASFSNREVNQRKQDKVHPTKTLIKSMIMKMMLTVSGGRDGLVSRWLS